MPKLGQHPQAYIRSSPNQGDSGGVVMSTFDSIRLCKCKWLILKVSEVTDAGFNRIIVETVGVGQSELEIADLVDIFVLLVAPGIGDELQVSNILNQLTSLGAQERNHRDGRYHSCQ